METVGAYTVGLILAVRVAVAYTTNHTTTLEDGVTRVASSALTGLVVVTVAERIDRNASGISWRVKVSERTTGTNTT